MTEIRDLVQTLVDHGIDPVEAADIIARAALYGAGNAPKKRSAGAIRQERYRRKKASQSVTKPSQSVTKRHSDAEPSQNVTEPSHVTPGPRARVEVTQLTKDKHNGKNKKNKTRASALEFAEEFWPIYPHKIGKADALKAFVKARKKASAQEIVEGVKRYVATKPADRPWCNPATFLNQERWTDEPAEVGNGRGPPAPENDLKAAIRRMNEDLGISDEPADTIDAEFTVN